MSRAHLAEWVRQLCGGTSATHDVDSMTDSELSRLVLLFISSQPAGART